MWHQLKGSKLVSYFGLFSSFGTLLCCAIPSTLVLLGFGAALAGFLSDFPQLIWLSENKGIVFGLSFFMLGISYLSQKYAEKLSCPIDKKEDCTETRSWTRKIFLGTLFINLIGATYAFVLPLFL